MAIGGQARGRGNSQQQTQPCRGLTRARFVGAAMRESMDGTQPANWISCCGGERGPAMGGASAGKPTPVR